MSSAARFSELKVVRWHERINAHLSGDNIGPIRVNIDLTNLCNHKCFFCEPVAFREETIRDKQHTLETEKAIELLYHLQKMGTNTIGFSGGGEPLIHHDFGLIATCANKLGFKTYLVTNGSFLRRWMHVMPLMTNVRVSLDASNPEEHAKMHGGKDFDQIIESLRELSGKTELGISYILSEHNSSPESLLWIQKFAKEIGAFIQFKPLTEDKPSEVGGWFPRNEESHLTEKRRTDVLYQREFSQCYAGLSTCVVSANGDVTVCCDRRDLAYGNIYQESFAEIWAKRRDTLSKVSPKLCQRCLMCDFNKSVQDNVVDDKAKTWLV